MNQLTLETREPEPIPTLVENTPVNEGTKISATNLITQSSNGISWEDMRGLSWIFYDEIDDI